MRPRSVAPWAPRDGRPDVTTKAPGERTFERIAAIDPNMKNLGYLVGTDGTAIEITIPGRQLSLGRRVQKCRRLLSSTTSELGRTRHPDRRAALDATARGQRSALAAAETELIDFQNVWLGLVVRKLYKKYDMIGLGAGMFSDDEGVPPTGTGKALIHAFRASLSRQARRSSKAFGLWNEYESTMKCSYCGHLHAKIAKGVDSWRCGRCKSSHLRDENAAINGLVRLCHRLNENLRGKTVKVKNREMWTATCDQFGSPRVEIKKNPGPYRRFSLLGALYALIKESLRVVGNLNEYLSRSPSADSRVDKKGGTK
jgi:putative transposase